MVFFLSWWCCVFCSKCADVERWRDVGVQGVSTKGGTSSIKDVGGKGVKDM